jgi:hypothetical protein
MGSFLSISCGSVTIKDSTWDGSLGGDGAAEFHTLKSDKAYLTLDEFIRKWEDLAHPMICTTVDTFADWKGIMEKLCSESPGKCKYEDQKKLIALMTRLTRYWHPAKQIPYVRADWRGFPD